MHRRCRGGRATHATARSAAAGGRCGTLAAAITTTHAVAISAAVTAAAEEGQLAAIAPENDLGRVFFNALLVGPFAGLELAFQIDAGTLAQILFGKPREVLVEDDHTMPFRALALLAAVAVFPALGSRDRQVDDLGAVLAAPDLGVAAEITDQNHLVHTACHGCLAPSRMGYGGLAQKARDRPLDYPSVCPNDNHEDVNENVKKPKVVSISLFCHQYLYKYSIGS